MSVRTLRYNTIEQHFTKSALASTDRDALAFLEAAQIYNTNQQRAIVNLVRSLKRVGLWSKMKAIYPFVGGTASSHKWNLKDPRDVDAAFRLTFIGGWTHSSTGADPNGTNGYADTYLVPTVSLTNNSTHISVYSREIGAASGSNERVEIASTAADPNRFEIVTNTNGFQFSDHYNFNTNRIVKAPGADGRGYFVSNRRTSTEHKFFRNNVQVQFTNTSTSSGFTSLIYNFYIASLRSPSGFYYYSEKETAFVTIGDGLTDTDATRLYNIVDLYQKRLGRAV